MTIKLFWKDPYKKTFKAQIVDIVNEGVILDRTIFYPESGNQDSDRGILEKNGNIFKVEAASYMNDNIIHHLKSPFQNKLNVGDIIKGKIDWNHRYALMKAHSSQHIFSAIFKKEFNIKTARAKIRGEHVILKLSKKIDFSKLKQALSIVNEIFILKNDKITQKVLSRGEAKIYEGEIRGELPNEDPIRLIITEDYDITCCGGTHVNQTNEIGPIFIYEFKKGNKIKYYVGKTALNSLGKYNTEFLSVADKFNIPLNQVKGRIEKHLEDSEEILEKNKFLTKKVLELILKNPDIEKEGIKISIIPFTIEHTLLNEVFEDFPEDTLLILELDNQVLKFITNCQQINAADLLNKLLKKFGGKGGGNPRISQGKIDEIPANIINEIKNLINSFFKNESKI